MSQPRFSIITTCKGRLGHLKQTLPAMLAQKNAEVIVVDFSCPDGTAAYVRQHHPAVKVVEVQNKNYFYNGEARNRGAERATGEQLIFCDADTVLAPIATKWLSNNLAANGIGTFATKESNDPKIRGEGLGRNQLRGFQVIGAKHFFSLGGYDEVLRGYAVGFDTDLLDMGIKLGLHPQPIHPKIIERVIEHDNVARLFYHTMPLKQSYLAGLLYRGVKSTLASLQANVRLPLEMRQQLFNSALQQARALGPDNGNASLSFKLEPASIGMPQELGFSSGKCEVAFSVTVSMTGPIDQVPD